MNNDQKTLSKWLPQKKKRTVIYDWDNTLFNALSPDIGKQLYLEKTGQPWPFTGWWGRLETLLPPLVNEPITEDHFVADTLAALREDRKRDDTNCYLMTGRPYKVKTRVLDILKIVQADFDGYYFRGGRNQSHLSDTLDIKLHIIANELIHPELNILEIWEDRDEHVIRFVEEANIWKNNHGQLQIVIHDVIAGKKHNI
jgi:hypothetical protein